jgi:thiol:disulfide interchange protein DsbC
MKTKTDVLVAIALAIASATALGAPPDPGATAMLQKLKGLYPATRFTSVGGTPIDGVYEVVMGQNVAYVGGDGRHFLFGHLFDMRTQKDLTADKLVTDGEPATQARQVNFATLPLHDAVRTVKGDGSRRLAVFSDPRCPYCRALDDEIAKLDNVTVYTFLLPWLSPESRPAAAALWAAAVPERANDTAVLDRNLKLASQLGLRGTPMLVAGDGRISEGARSAEALDAWLTPEAREVAERTSAVKEQP